MGWVIGILGATVVVPMVVFLAAASVALIVGRRYPADHTFTRAIRLSKPPDEVWRVITDFARQNAWNTNVRSAEKLPDREGREVWKEITAHGRPMTLETLEAAAGIRLVRSIVDEKHIFSGTWTWDLTPEGAGTQLQLTERGHVENPIFRFMVRRFGEGRYVEAYLRALATHLGDAPRFE